MRTVVPVSPAQSAASSARPDAGAAGRLCGVCGRRALGGGPPHRCAAHQPAAAQPAAAQPAAAQPVKEDGPAAKKPAAAEPQAPEAGAPPASKMNMVQRLAVMDEGALAALQLLNAASRTQSSQVGSATVSVPPGVPGQPSGACPGIEESEDERESDEDTEEGGGTGKGKTAMKAMKAMKVMKAMKAAKATEGKKASVSQDNLPKGWKVVMKRRPSNADMKDKTWVAPSGEQFDRWAKVVKFLAG